MGEQKNRIREDSMMLILTGVRMKYENIEEYIRNQWGSKYRYYLGSFFKECGGDVRKFDSFEIAAIVAFSMSHGFENRSEYSKMQKCIKELLDNPYRCTVRKLTGADGENEYVCEDKELLQPLKENDELVSQRASETIALLEQYVFFSAKFPEMKALIAKFRQTYEKYKAL